jgi:hypothetical protein
MAKVNLGVELDGDFSPLDVGVSPEDLYWSPYTSVVAMEQCVDPNGNTISEKVYSASATLYKVTTFIDEIYYDDDYDPWPSGAGEEYVETYTGDGYFPSTEQLPYPDGIKGNGVGAYRSRDGAGSIDWNQYSYALVSYNAPLKIRVCPGELDDTSGDDWYPAWQWWFEPSTWHSYVGGTWYYTTGTHAVGSGAGQYGGTLHDEGDCRFRLSFKIQAV